MNFRYKFILFITLFFSVVYINFPNFIEFIPGLKGNLTSFYHEREAELKTSLQKLHKLNLFIAYKEENRIGVIGSNLNDLQTLQNDPLLKDFFEYAIDVEDEVAYFVFEDEKKNQLSEQAGILNRLINNAKKIKTIEYQAEKEQIFFTLEEGSRLSIIQEPIKTFLKNDLDWIYDFEKNGYSSRKKQADLLVNLGLDLKGGIYLDLELESEELFTNLLKNLKEDLRSHFTEKGIFVIDISIIDNSSIIIKLDPTEVINWESDELDTYLSSFNVQNQENGIYIATLTDSEVEIIRNSAVDQVINTLNNRIDLLGVKEPTIQKKGNNSIIVQLPGQTDPARARRVIQQSAKLEFRFVANSIDNFENTIELNYEIKDSITGEILQIEPIIVEDRVVLGGDSIREARVVFSNTTGLPYVNISFNSKGSKTFGDITEKNIGRQLAVILDNKVQSYPTIQEAIYGGNAQISGTFTNKEASDLALILRTGSLPTSLKINEERSVGASLGEDSVRDTMLALLIGFLLVIILILIYYQLSGVFCIIVLLFNILFIFAALSYFKATLTLPGMAGIILTVGMAVDANILIFERIKEEMKSNINLRQAINLGFNRSFWTIIDANITTLLAAGILFYFGTGSIKGFSVTLSIGIIASLFSSLVFTRFFFELFYLRKLKFNKISI